MIIVFMIAINVAGMAQAAVTLSPRAAFPNGQEQQRYVLRPLMAYTFYRW